MGLERHTLVLVPHGGGRSRKLRVSNRQIRFLTAAVLLLTAAAGASLWYAYAEHSTAAQLAQLQAENEELRTANLQFEESARRLQSRLTTYEDRTEELAIIAGVEDAMTPLDDPSVTTEVGVGGFGAPGDFLPDLPTMEDRAENLGRQLDVVGNRLDERRLLISARPAIMPVKGVFTSGYGYRADPITGLQAFHRGIDVSAPHGNEIRATADGVVARASQVGGYGRAVFVAHGFGYSTRYGHLSQIDVEPGQKVKRGDILGRVGRSGRATGYHVHYEVYQEGASRNPLEFVLNRRPRR